MKGVSRKPIPQSLSVYGERQQTARRAASSFPSEASSDTQHLILSPYLSRIHQNIYEIGEFCEDALSYLYTT